MIKIRTTHICDACGKRHVENLELTNDYLQTLDAIGDSELPYMPEGWSVDVFSDEPDAEQRLLCKKCTKTSEIFHGNDNRIVCDTYPWNISESDKQKAYQKLLNTPNVNPELLALADRPVLSAIDIEMKYPKRRD